MTQLVKRTESKRYPGLFVKKYTRKVFYDNLWNQSKELLESRGHVELADGTTVIRPFTKIFNRFENGTDIHRDYRCIWIEKINGFMAAATYVDHVKDVVVSTTGSLDSDYVKIAEKYITNKVKYSIRKKVGYTFLFEIVDPEDPHIIPEIPGAYLIGLRKVDDNQPYFTNSMKETFLDWIADDMGVRRPTWNDEMRFGDIVELAKTYVCEGMVVYSQIAGTSLKIKTPYYLVLKMLARKKDIMSLNIQKVDEEFYPLIEHLHANLCMFNSLSEQDRLTYMRKFLENSYE